MLAHSPTKKKKKKRRASVSPTGFNATSAVWRIASSRLPFITSPAQGAQHRDGRRGWQRVAVFAQRIQSQRARKGSITCQDRGRSLRCSLGTWLPSLPSCGREGDVGEIEAAEKGPLPRLVEVGDLAGTFHCHATDWSDGRATLEEMAQAAQSSRTLLPRDRGPFSSGGLRRGSGVSIESASSGLRSTP